MGAGARDLMRDGGHLQVAHHPRIGRENIVEESRQESIIVRVDEGELIIFDVFR